MPQQDHDVQECLDQLRHALRANGITLPSLRAELGTFSGEYGGGLVALGNCNTGTARRLAEALRKAAVR